MAYVIHKESLTEKITQTTYRLLTQNLTSTSVLFLSGGNSPQNLYLQIVKEGLPIKPKAVCMTDERYGVPTDATNYYMLEQTGLIDYLYTKNIPFHQITTADLTLEEATQRYNQVLHNLFATTDTFVGIMGIGKDGHTAGLAPNTTNFSNPLYEITDKKTLVGSFTNTNPTWHYPKRITITPHVISLFNIVILILTGNDKQTALQTFLTKDLSIPEFPAMLYKNKRMRAHILTNLQT